MTHPFELHTSRTVQRLRKRHRIKRKPSELFLGRDVSFCWDTIDGDLALETWSEAGLLLGAKADVQRQPAWVSFHLALRKGRFEAGDILGLTLDFDGFAGETLPLFIRSARRGGHWVDSPLQQPLQGHRQRAMQTVLHTVHSQSALCGPAAFHTLIFSLPLRDFSFRLYDLGLFVLPAGRGPTLGADQLGASA